MTYAPLGAGPAEPAGPSGRGRKGPGSATSSPAKGGSTQPLQQQQEEDDDFWDDEEGASGERSRLLGEDGDPSSSNCCSNEQTTDVASFDIVVEGSRGLPRVWRKRLALMAKVLAGVALVALIACAYTYLDVAKVQRVVTFFKQHPGQTLPLWCLGHSFAVSLGFPGMIPQTLCGFLFGFGLGLPAAFVSTCVGQSLAFLLGRYMLKDCLTRFIQRKIPNFAAIESALFKEGWRLLFLLRVAPVLPDNISNFSLSITSLTWATFSLVSAAALAPYSILYVYSGSASSDVMDIIGGGGSSGAGGGGGDSGGGDGDNKGGGTLKLVITCVSALMAGVAFAYVVVSVKRALKKVLDEQGQGQGQDGAGGGGKAPGEPGSSQRPNGAPVGGLMV